MNVTCFMTLEMKECKSPLANSHEVSINISLCVVASPCIIITEWFHLILNRSINKQPMYTNAYIVLKKRMKTELSFHNSTSCYITCNNNT